ncbi:MAG: MFS transporter [Mycobacterium leprae]
MTSIRTRAALWAVFAATAAVRIGFGGIAPVLPLYAEQHGLNTMMIAIMTNAYLLSNALFQSYAGHLGDRWGRRPVMLAGTWLYTIAAALFLLDRGPWYYVALRGIEGLGASAFGPTARAYVADLVPASRRGRAFGMLNSFDMAGILLGPMIGGLAQSWAGPRAPFALCALLGLLAGIPLLLLARQEKAAEEETDDAGSLAPAPAPKGNLPVSVLLRSPAFWAVALPGFGFAYLNGLYSVIWSLYMNRVGATTLQISLSFTLFAVPMVLLMVPFGALADRVGRPLLVGVGGAISAFVTVFYGLLPYPNWLIGLSMVDGISSSMFSPASQAYMADVTPDAIRGKFIGLVGSVTTAATMVCATLVGYLYEHSTPVVLFALGTVALLFSCSSAVIIMVRYPADHLRRSLEEQSRGLTPAGAE